MSKGRTGHSPSDRRSSRSGRTITSDSAAIIRNRDDSHAVVQNLSWDDATTLMVEHMRGENLRPNSISTYETVLTILRKVCPKTVGPASIPPAMAEQYKLARL